LTGRGEHMQAGAFHLPDARSHLHKAMCHGYDPCAQTDCWTRDVAIIYKAKDEPGSRGPPETNQQHFPSLTVRTPTKPNMRPFTASAILAFAALAHAQTPAPFPPTALVQNYCGENVFITLANTTGTSGPFQLNPGEAVSPLTQSPSQNPSS